MKRGTLADRALMRGVLRIERQRGLAKSQVGSVDDVITAWRVRLGRNENELAEVIREEGTPRLRRPPSSV